MRDEPQGVSRGFRDTGRQARVHQDLGKVCVQIEKTGAVTSRRGPAVTARSGE